MNPKKKVTKRNPYMNPAKQPKQIPADLTSPAKVNDAELAPGDIVNLPVCERILIEAILRFQGLEEESRQLSVPYFYSFYLALHFPSRVERGVVELSMGTDGTVHRDVHFGDELFRHLVWLYETRIFHAFHKLLAHHPDGRFGFPMSPG